MQKIIPVVLISGFVIFGCLGISLAKAPSSPTNRNYYTVTEFNKIGWTAAGSVYIVAGKVASNTGDIDHCKNVWCSRYGTLVITDPVNTTEKLAINYSNPVSNPTHGENALIDKEYYFVVNGIGAADNYNLKSYSLSFQQLPYNSIEEAVRASGGTYGVIDTNNPDKTNDFVQTVFDKGLTNSDEGQDCWSMNIRPSVKISCRLSANKDAYYYYEGKKGEKVTITVSAKNFVPEIDISDANGTMEFFDNKQKQNFLTVTKTLSYTGKYIFEVKTRYYFETKEGEPFTINLTSDKSNTQSDIRKDTLVAGKKYSVYDLLNFNQSTVARNFLTNAFVSDIYKNPPCPPEAYSCQKSLPPNITISDCYGDCSDTKSYTTLWLGTKNNFTFAIGKRYQFEVSVINTSNTNIPQNKFSLVAVKNLDGTTVLIGTSTANIENQKTSVFTEIWKWFSNLFK